MYQIINNNKKIFNKKQILFAAISTHLDEELLCANIHLI